MTNQNFDARYVRSRLLHLFETASNAGFNWHKDHIWTLINVGEYSLALDEMAAAYINSDQVIPSEVFSTFGDLAAKMGMVHGDEWEAVANLRARS